MQVFAGMKVRFAVKCTEVVQSWLRKTRDIF